MNAMIENEELLIEKSHDKKILSCLNRIKKAVEEIYSLGYETYMAEHGSFNVMNVEGAGGYKYQSDFDSTMVVANIQVKGIDGGAW